MRIRIPAAAFRDPADSEIPMVRIETAYDCHGEECNETVFSADGELEPRPPHYHLVESGKQPEAGPRCVAIGLESARSTTHRVAPDVATRGVTLPLRCGPNKEVLY